MLWWCTDDALKMHWWCAEYALIMLRWCTGDALLVHRLCTYDAMVRHWWCTDYALMMHWWCTDDAQMMHRWWIYICMMHVMKCFFPNSIWTILDLWKMKYCKTNPHILFLWIMKQKCCLTDCERECYCNIIICLMKYGAWYEGLVKRNFVWWVMKMENCFIII